MKTAKKVKSHMQNPNKSNNYLFDLSDQFLNKESKIIKNYEQYNKFIEKNLNSGNFVQVDLKINGLIAIVEKQKSGTYDFLKLYNEHTFKSPKFIVDYVFGDYEIINLSPEIVLNLFIAKYGTKNRAIKEINFRLNEKSN